MGGGREERESTREDKRMRRTDLHLFLEIRSLWSFADYSPVNTDSDWSHFEYEYEVVGGWREEVLCGEKGRSDLQLHPKSISKSWKFFRLAQTSSGFDLLSCSETFIESLSSSFSHPKVPLPWASLSVSCTEIGENRTVFRKSSLIGSCFNNVFSSRANKGLLHIAMREVLHHDQKFNSQRESTQIDKIRN